VASGDGLIYADGVFSVYGLADRPGWVLYATDRHGEWLWGLSDAEAAGLGPFLKVVSAALKEASGAPLIYYVGLGENTVHYHGILTARYEPFAKDIQTALAERGAEVADAEQAARTITAMKDYLSSH
jgi:hypothetical protein